MGAQTCSEFTVNRPPGLFRGEYDYNGFDTSCAEPLVALPRIGQTPDARGAVDLISRWRVRAP